MSLTASDAFNLQRALQALGYPLPRWGADGAIGRETLGALAQLLTDHGRPVAEVPGEVTGADLEFVAGIVRAGAAAPVTNPVLRAVHLLNAHELGNAPHHYWLGTGDYLGEDRPPWTRNNGGEGSDCWGLIAWAHRQPRFRKGYNPGGSVVDWIQCDSAIEDAEGRRVAWRPAEQPEPGDIVVYPSIVGGGQRARIGHVALIESTERLRDRRWTGAEWTLLDVIHVCGPNRRRPAAVRASGALWTRRERAGGLGENPAWRSRVLRIVAG